MRRGGVGVCVCGGGGGVRGAGGGGGILKRCSTDVRKKNMT